jgi:hypothetical protein
MRAHARARAGAYGYSAGMRAALLPTLQEASERRRERRKLLDRFLSRLCARCFFMAKPAPGNLRCVHLRDLNMHARIHIYALGPARVCASAHYLFSASWLLPLQ